MLIHHLPLAFLTTTTLANQSGYRASWMKFATSSLSTFSLIAFCLSGVKFHFFYHTGLCTGFTFSLWIITSRGIPRISNTVQATISTFLHRKDNNSSRSGELSDDQTCTILIGSLSLSRMKINYSIGSPQISSSQRTNPSTSRACDGASFGPKPWSIIKPTVDPLKFFYSKFSQESCKKMTSQGYHLKDL